MKKRVIIMPKEGILDPQGRALKDVLNEAGFNIKDVRIGKIVEIEADSLENLQKMIEDYIINPLIEDYEVL
ncbi:MULTISPECIES: phosphoribosylformylglycinamidine synthase subunit PurS [unclassified Hydrogenobaculum]|uniref:phosphoribosylformylglycinamidine synthase subunit PurS n=1 Tax=unclassified Hydrogenobaculum TaxID=2622382 RepID=UPI0001C51070|nr:MULTISPECIES: phosphoribosylformylglycinamidine synthase subunit PurS [unclassified Hydrogenobaculum]AEF18945.1 phosphoribosylformylglycinamidine synthase, purS [Hydrogenobaculum sp. 3684]AEG46232.1 phosphoribosylformylglycinamidine synthase, purS [Hydrogenobaculum sp. SHO]AGG14877.1 phosphoribosylformylglycinamidine synthase, purS [Hydrogenobaculum sp. HO]AGH93173.1 phosphoribosylformylglycinamidine synthase, purS protein [Hydrogenobaculum sp. SN]